MKPANRIKELREAQKLTVRELAALVAFHLDGDKEKFDIHFTTISKHENGEREVSSDYIKAYAKAFKCDTHQLFFV